MKKMIDITPVPYKQPENGFISRIVEDTIEKVEYLKESNLRFWYNNQVDGYPSHWHSAIEVIIPVENYYEVIINQNKYCLNVGDILFVPPGVLHELLGCDYGARFIYLINLDMFTQLHDFKMISFLIYSPLYINRNTHPEIYDKLHSLFMKMNDIYFSNDFLWEFSIYSLFMDVITLIGRSHFQTINNQSSLQPTKQKEYYKKFSELILYIDNHYADDISLDDMALQTGFSKFHFSRLFKEYINFTFYDYLCHKRVQVAQSLLSTSMSITDIAFQTGFNNLSTFCRTFKKYANCSPTEYRNNFLSLHN